MSTRSSDAERGGARWRVLVQAGWMMVVAVVVAVGCSKPDPEAAGPGAEPDRSERSFERRPENIEWPAPEVPAQDRLAWNLATLTGDYDRVGTRDGKWDAAAREFLTGFARIRARTNSLGDARMEALAGQLLEAGCLDPMVQYLVLRHRPDAAARTAVQRAEDARRIADEMAASEYSIVRKFYSALRASEHWKAAHGNSAGSAAVYNPYRERAFESLVRMLQAPELPVLEAVDAIRDYAAAVEANAAVEDWTLPTLIQCLGRRWPENAAALLQRGRLQITLAWNRRGGGYAPSVTEAGWEGFQAHMEGAGRDLEKSWKLDPQRPDAAVSMLRVLLSRETDVGRARLWLNRAMEADPACYAATHAMAWYLQPKWHGSAEQALAFGRKCVENRSWKGDVPLTLIDVHEMLANDRATGEKEAHWKRPEVWKDVQAAYNRFFELNPQATWTRNHYARYAFKCGQYGAFLDLLPRLEPLDESVFGGRSGLDTLIAEATAATGRKAERPAASR